MKINYQFLLILIVTCLFTTPALKGQSAVSQKNTTHTKTTPGGKIKWMSNPFDHQVYIENKGQFEGQPNGDEILYGAQVGNVYVFITPHGLIYKYTDFPGVRVSPDKKKYEMLDPDDVNWAKAKPVDHYLTATWEGSTDNVTTIAGEEQTYYYTYPGADNKSTIKVNIFKTVTCHNVYPGIDIKYTFPDGKDGFKYAFIVHPGADLSVIKLKYDGAKKMKLDADGNIEINSGWGQFTDHAPLSYYDGENSQVSSGYHLHGDTESFIVSNPDVSKTLVIDPWSTNWSTSYSGTSGYDGAYDLDYDYAGNVYIYGGYNPFQLAKYNSSGVQQWTYNTTNFPYIYFGAFCVEKSSGVAFCFEGFGGGGYAYTDKVSPSGALLNTLTTNTLDEQWRAAYDLCSHTIAIAGGGVSLSYQAATLDTTNNFYTRANVLGLPPGSGYHDLCLIASDPIVDTTYMATTWTYANVSLDNNKLLRLPMPSLSPTAYSVYDGFNFQECTSPAYVATGHGNTNGMNGMSVSPNWLYIYDGDTLRQLDKNTGAINNSVNISGTYFTWGGISVDLCDDIYLGNADSVDIYNSSLSYTGSIGSFSGNVYDVVLGNGVLSSADSTLYVCGKGFVASIQIDPPNPPSVTKSRTYHCSCTCTATGTLTYCGNADTSSNVSYLWSDGQTTHTATGLCPGNTYTLTVSLGCSQQFVDTFDMPYSNLFHMTESHVNPTCGLCNGTATDSANGGGAHYTYLWTPGGQTTQTATGLCPGTYSVTVTDSCGDTNNAVVTLTTVGLTLTPHLIANEKCNGSCIGIASVSVAGGVTPYTYHWSPGGQTSDTATGLCAGTDTVKVTDINGCAGTASLFIAQPTPVVATIASSANPLCFGGTGTATAGSSGGISPYSYSWSHIGGTNATGTGLTVGSYTVTVTDSNGCTATASVTLTQPAIVTATISAKSNVLCNGGTGAATVTAGGGTSPYGYVWANRGGTNAQGTGLTAGSYTVTVTDHNGCTATVSTTITQPTLLTDSITAIVHAACNLPNGKTTAIGRGGTGPYTYMWTPTSQTTTQATGLSVGIYTVTVTDNNHCTASITASITQPTAVTATITSTKGVGCFNGGNGSATVTAGGGSTPYTYLWSPGGNTSSSATGLFALGYTVTVTDANGCTMTASTTITEPPQLSVSITEPKLICKDSTGNLLANTGGGTSPYRYAWSGGVTSTTNTATITPIATRYFSVEVTDANGCTATGQITLAYGPSVAVEILGKNSTCVGDSTTLCAYGSGGMGTDTYLWQPENTTNQCITVTPGAASVYTVTVVDGCGATTTASETVYTVPSPVINMYANFYQGCEPLCVQFHNGTTISEGGIREYIWSFGNGDTSHEANPIYCYTNSGNYDITLTAVSDSGCSATKKKINLVEVYTKPEAAFTYSPDPATIITPEITFTDESRDAYGIAYHWWNFGEGGDTESNLSNPVHVYRDTGSYCVNLVVMNLHGCTDTATNCLVVEPAFTLYIPSAFTPNGDGLNESFAPKGKYIQSFEMYIFDRWGMQIYHSTDINQGWDGKVHGSADVSQEDVYVYKITVTDSEGNQHSYIGNVTLLK